MDQRLSLNTCCTHFCVLIEFFKTIEYVQRKDHKFHWMNLQQFGFVFGFFGY